MELVSTPSSTPLVSVVQNESKTKAKASSLIQDLEALEHELHHQQSQNHELVLLVKELRGSLDFSVASIANQSDLIAKVNAQLEFERRQSQSVSQERRQLEISLDDVAVRLKELGQWIVQEAGITTLEKGEPAIRVAVASLKAEIKIQQGSILELQAQLLARETQSRLIEQVATEEKLQLNRELELARSFAVQVQGEVLRVGSDLKNSFLANENYWRAQVQELTESRRQLQGDIQRLQEKQKLRIEHEFHAAGIRDRQVIDPNPAYVSEIRSLRAEVNEAKLALQNQNAAAILASTQDQGLATQALRHKIQALETELEQARGQFMQARERLSQELLTETTAHRLADEAFKALQFESQQRQLAVDALNLELESLRRERNDSQLLADQATSEIASLRAELSATWREVAAQASTAADARARMEIGQQQISQWRERHEAEKSNLARALESQDLQMQEKNEDLILAHSANEKLQRQLEDLRQEVLAKTVHEQSLKREVQDLEGRISKKTVEFDSLLKASSDLRSELESLTAANKATIQNHSLLVAEAAAKERQLLADSVVRTEEFARERSSMQQSAAQIADELAQTVDDLRESKRLVDQQVTLVEQLRHQLAVKSEDDQKRVVEARQSIDLAISRESQLNQYAELVNETKREVRLHAERLLAEIQLMKGMSPLTDFMQVTQREIVRVEMSLHKTPTLSADRARLEQTLEDLLKQREYLKNLIGQSHADFDSRIGRLQRLVGSDALGLTPPPPPRLWG
jgi:hypothetical protein